MTDHLKKTVVYTMENCPYCLEAKKLLQRRGIVYEEIRVQWDDDAQWDALYVRSGLRTMPQIFCGDELIGGYQDLAKRDAQDELLSLQSPPARAG